MHRNQQFDPWSPQKKEREMLACNPGTETLGGHRSLRFTGQHAYLTESESPVLRNMAGIHG